MASYKKYRPTDSFSHSKNYKLRLLKITLSWEKNKRIKMQGKFLPMLPREIPNKGKYKTSLEELLKDDEWIIEKKRDGKHQILVLHLIGRECSSWWLLNKNSELIYKSGSTHHVLDQILQKAKFDKTTFESIPYIVFDVETVWVCNNKDHRTKAQAEESQRQFILNNKNGIPPIFEKYVLLDLIDELKIWLDRYKIMFDWWNQLKDDDKNQILQITQPIQYEIPKNIIFNDAKINNEEGVIFKKKNSIYEPGKSYNILKYKFEETDDFIVIGFTEAQPGKREEYIGALVLAQYDSNGEIQPKGLCGGGFKDEDLIHINTILKHVLKFGDTCPHTSINAKDYSKAMNDIFWLTETDYFVIEVKYNRLTEYGIPMHPCFKDFRDDKSIKECITDNEV